MSGRYDVIVIGAGVNGLTAAAFLAKAGRKVLMLERASWVGGLAAGHEFHPGYGTSGTLHDTSGVRRWVVEELNLRDHGLELEPEPPSVFSPQEDGPGLLVSYSPDAAQREIQAFSKGDASAYGEYRTFLDELKKAVSPLLNETPPDLFNAGAGDRWQLIRRGFPALRWGKKRLFEAARIGPMCVADWLNEWFETDPLKTALAGPAIQGTMNGPWSPGSAANLLLYECSAQGHVRGGPAALAAALEKAARAAGVDIRTGAEVEEIRIVSGRVEGVTGAGGEEIAAPCVAASCDPRRTFLNLVPSRHLSFQLEQRIRHFRGRGATAKINLALNSPLEFSGRSGEGFEFVRIGRDLDSMERAFDPSKYGELPERPLLDIHVPTVSDPLLAPSGHCVVSVLASFIPYSLKDGWTDDTRRRLGDAVLDELGRYAPGLKDRVVGQEVLTPPDLEERLGLVEGHLFHGDHALDQLVARPAPECSQYETPIGGLFLCGGGNHPGGGLTCAPGALGGKALLKKF